MAVLLWVGNAWAATHWDKWVSNNIVTIKHNGNPFIFSPGFANQLDIKIGDKVEIPESTEFYLFRAKVGSWPDFGRPSVFNELTVQNFEQVVNITEDLTGNIGVTTVICDDGIEVGCQYLYQIIGVNDVVFNAGTADEYTETQLVSYSLAWESKKFGPEIKPIIDNNAIGYSLNNGKINLNVSIKQREKLNDKFSFVEKLIVTSIDTDDNVSELYCLNLNGAAVEAEERKFTIEPTWAIGQQYGIKLKHTVEIQEEEIEAVEVYRKEVSKWIAREFESFLQKPSIIPGNNSFDIHINTIPGKNSDYNTQNQRIAIFLDNELVTEYTYDPDLVDPESYKFTHYIVSPLAGEKYTLKIEQQINDGSFWVTQESTEKSLIAVTTAPEVTGFKASTITLKNNCATVTLEWDDISGSSYTIMKGNESKSTTGTSIDFNMSSGENTFTISRTLNGSNSDAITLTVKNPGISFVAAKRPGSDKVILKWFSDEELSSYRIKSFNHHTYSTGSNCKSAFILTDNFNSFPNEFKFYFDANYDDIQVKAGEELIADQSFVTIFGNATNVTAKDCNTGIALNWSSVTDASEYRILYRRPGQRNFTANNSDITATSYIDSNVKNNNTYSYKIKSYYDDDIYTESEVVTHTFAPFANVADFAVSIPENNKGIKVDIPAGILADKLFILRECANDNNISERTNITGGQDWTSTSANIEITSYTNEGCGLYTIPLSSNNGSSVTTDNLTFIDKDVRNGETWKYYIIPLLENVNSGKLWGSFPDSNDPYRNDWKTLVFNPLSFPDGWEVTTIDYNDGSRDGIKLSWPEVGNVSGYKVVRRNYNNNNHAASTDWDELIIDNVNYSYQSVGSGTSFVDDDVYNGEWWEYTLIPYIDRTDPFEDITVNNGLWINHNYFPLSKIYTVKNVTLNSFTSLYVTWDKVENVKGYYVLRKKENEDSKNWSSYDDFKENIIATIYDTETLSYSDSDLDENTTYAYAFVPFLKEEKSFKFSNSWKTCTYSPILLDDYELALNTENCYLDWTLPVGFTAGDNVTITASLWKNGATSAAWTKTKLTDLENFGLSELENGGAYLLKLDVVTASGDAYTTSFDVFVSAGPTDAVDLGDSELTEKLYFAYAPITAHSKVKDGNATQIIAYSVYLEPGFVAVAPEEGEVVITAGEYSGNLILPNNPQVSFNSSVDKGNSLDLKWSHNLISTVNSFKVTLVSDGVQYEFDPVNPHPTSSTEFDKSILVENKEYEPHNTVGFRIAACSNKGYRATIGTPLINLVPEKADAKINGISHNSVELQWSNVYASSYLVQRKDADETDFSTLITVAEDGNQSSYTYTDVTCLPNHEYEYRIVTWGIGYDENSAINVVEGDPVTAITAPDVVYTEIDFDNCQYNWKANRDNVDNHWIPNDTSSLGYLKGFKINVGSGSLINNNKILGDKFRELKILPPVDPYYQKPINRDKHGDNVLTNRGTWPLNFYAVSGDEYQLLCRFEINADSENSENAYKITFENSNASYRVEEDNNQLKVIIGSTTFTEFALKFDHGPNSQSLWLIRPGDDFLLRFGCANYNNHKTETRPGDFFAAYDKKMLWRASLYIDEGESDWNDHNKWIVDNEWNYEYDGKSSLRRKDHFWESADRMLSNPDVVDNLKSGDGGQVVAFQKFTKPYYRTPKGAVLSIEGDVKDLVAYAYGCQDSPFEYNHKLWQQSEYLQYAISKSLINEYSIPRYNRKGVLTTKEIYVDYKTLEMRSDKFGVPYNADDADDYSYEFYFQPSELRNLSGALLYHHYLKGNIFPFLPSGSFSIMDATTFWTQAISAGVDCIGLTQTAASYKGNKYVWNNLDWNYNPSIKETWALSYKGKGRSYPRSRNNYSWNIVNSNESSDNNDNRYEKRVGRVVPGDIFYYDEAKKHIAMVLSVEYDDNHNRFATPQQVTLIEATWAIDEGNGEKGAYVTNSNNLEFYTNRNWNLVRLRTSDDAK